MVKKDLSILAVHVNLKLKYLKHLYKETELIVPSCN